MEVTFNLGPSTGLSKRQLTITKIPNAGEDPGSISADVDTDVGAVTTTSQELPPNRIYTAKLVDTVSNDGSTRPAQLIRFHTGSLQYLKGRASQPSGSEFYVLHMTETSSSSSSSSSSVSSSSSSQSG